MSKIEDKSNIRCSFCGKSQSEVQRLVAGPGVYICNECIELCQEIIEDDYTLEPPDLKTIPKPHEIVEPLDS